jgi:hypothetical protein
VPVALALCASVTLALCGLTYALLNQSQRLDELEERQACAFLEAQRPR